MKVAGDKLRRWRNKRWVQREEKKKKKICGQRKNTYRLKEIRELRNCIAVALSSTTSMSVICTALDQASSLSRKLAYVPGPTFRFVKLLASSGSHCTKWADEQHWQAGFESRLLPDLPLPFIPTLIGLRAFDLVSSRVWWEAATNTTTSMSVKAIFVGWSTKTQLLIVLGTFVFLLILCGDFENIEAIRHGEWTQRASWLFSKQEIFSTSHPSYQKRKIPPQESAIYIYIYIYIYSSHLHERDAIIIIIISRW